MRPLIGVAALALGLLGMPGCGRGAPTDSESTGPSTSTVMTSVVETTIPTTVARTTTIPTTVAVETTVASTVPDAALVAAFPAVTGYVYSNFSGEAPRLENAVSVMADVVGPGGKGTVTLEKTPTPLSLEQQLGELELLGEVYGQNAWGMIALRLIGTAPILVTDSDLETPGLNWTWMHDGILYWVHGDEGLEDYVSSVATAEDPSQVPLPAQEIALLEGTVPSRFFPVSGFKYVEAPHGMELKALENSGFDSMNYAYRMVTTPGVKIVPRDFFSVRASKPDVISIEGGKLSLMDWYSIKQAQQQGAFDDDQYHTLPVGQVLVTMSDQSWRWLDGRMLMQAWAADPEVFERFRPFLEQLIASQAALPLLLS